MKILFLTICLFSLSALTVRAQKETHTGTILKAVVKKHFTENDSAKVEFELFIDLTNDNMSINYPCITIRERKTGKLITSTGWSYYVHPDEKSPYTLVIPKQVLKKRKYQMYMEVGIHKKPGDDSIELSMKPLKTLSKK